MSEFKELDIVYQDGDRLVVLEGEPDEDGDIHIYNFDGGYDDYVTPSELSRTPAEQMEFTVKEIAEVLGISVTRLRIKE